MRLCRGRTLAYLYFEHDAIRDERANEKAAYSCKWVMASWVAVWSLAYPSYFRAVPLQTRKEAQKRESVRLFKCCYFLCRLNGNEGGILLVVAVLPIHPFVPLVKIKLAALPAFILSS